MKRTTGTAELTTAIEQVVHVFGPLPSRALDAFSSKFGALSGEHFEPEFALQEILPRLIRRQRIYLVPGEKVAGRPSQKLAGSDSKSELAYWVFLEHMDNSALASLMPGPAPAVATYFKGGNLYHIVVCDGAGETELGLSAHLLAQTDERRIGGAASVEEKFLIVFSSQQYLEQAKTLCVPRALLSVVTHDDRGIPTVRFIKPNYS